MNVFGKFSYGNLIKTFIPGIAIVLGFALCIDAFIYLADNEYQICSYASDHSVFVVAMVIPLAIFLGIISNTFCWVYVTPKVIVDQYNISNPELIERKKIIKKQIKKHFIALTIPQLESNDVHLKDLDFKSLLLNFSSLENIHYLKESYWYYLEFQMNSIVAATMLQISLMLNLFVRYMKDSISLPTVIPIIGSSIFIYLLMIILFHRAAKRNYAVHEEKEFSYFVGVYYNVINAKDNKK